MAKHSAEQIVEGVTIDRQGMVVVGEGFQKTLCDLALDLQERTPHAVDVEHVLAALVMAVRDGKIPRNSSLSSSDGERNGILCRYIEVLFQRYAGKINGEK